ncbi:YbgC/FadM family acyl-CoA thioesterase [Algiphilus sp.]|uniref:YbgC/FadM family acyl-CoA thioesterase n=1 Tax=Algiphilus sp. TaxID=1872431 RepID=UPI001CA668F8|nr:YbgC/FadM family acyl-CoA thioesterase [Algiphilus sp.]MBY8965180.1 YbgC/FadM family acyl-CoA thioesterase [Algiphilus acroporae]MCI5063247.1 YbgC/FadM family acyl-CoA thioesterase [Algiphilus sp.]MCI5104934.1 YbgC/FadM family acyl-CoA thioesterase [Algiphilus sp.]
MPGDNTPTRLDQAIHPVRVYYEDTDASGVAYHGSYVRWMERGRTEWLRARGGSQALFMIDQGLAFTLSRLEMRFVAPARLDDALDVVTTVERFGRASIDFRQEVRLQDSAQILVRASARVGCVDQQHFRPAPLPSSIAPPRKPNA